MDFTILPYDRLPEFIRENENLRQTLLRSGGIMKYMAEHIDDPFDDDTPLLFVQYQNYVAENYRRANRWNPNRQNWSAEDLRQRALNGNNHLWYELQSRRVLMRELRLQPDVPFDAQSMIDILNWKYLDYAWKEDLRRRRPDIETDLGTYRYVIQQFERFNGLGCLTIDSELACRSIDLALKKHHGYELTETDIYNSFNIDMFHAHFFGPTIEGSLKRGIKDLLQGKTAKACQEEAISMLKTVQWFSQHIYNDDFEDVLNNSFTIEDKKWLRSLLEHYDRDSFSEEELNFFYFGMLLADVGRLWYRMLRRYADIDLSELEKEANSFVNTDSSVNQDTWEDEEDIFENDEPQNALNKYEYSLEDVRYDVETGAAAPVNREPKRTGDEEKSTNSSIKPVGHKTFTFSIDGETPDMKNNRLAQARIILINRHFMSASEQQWKDLFSGHTTHEKIKWIGEKGNIVYFFQAIKDSIKNLTGFGLWEIVAAHFCWEYTYAKSKKTVKEDFDHVKLSQGKAKQNKYLDEAASWFKPEMNPNYKIEEKEEDSPYTYNEPLTNSELESDAWSNDLDVPPEELIYPENEEDENDSSFRLSDDY